MACLEALVQKDVKTSPSFQMIQMCGYFQTSLGWGEGKMGQSAFDLQEDIYGPKAVVCLACVLRNGDVPFLC